MYSDARNDSADCGHEANMRRTYSQNYSSTPDVAHGAISVNGIEGIYFVDNNEYMKDTTILGYDC